MRQPPVRTLRSTLRGLLAVTALTVLVGCGSADLPVDPSPAPPTERTEQTERPDGAPVATNTPATPTADQPTVAAVSETIVCSPDGPTPKPFTGPAVAEFGADAVLDAYCESAAFFVQRGVTNLTDPAAADPRNASRDLRFVNDWLTVGAAQQWARTAAAAAGSPKAERALSDLTYYRLALPRGYAYPEGGPMAVGGEVSEAMADVATLADGRTALALWYSVSVDLPVARAGVAGARPATHALGLARKVAVYLVTNPDPRAPDDRSWLIESWTTNWESGAVEPWADGR